MSRYGFDTVVGNLITIRLIKRALKNGTFPQFSILTGPYGTGKSTNAKNIALALTCRNTLNGEACMCCSSCRASIDAFEKTGQSLDIKIVNLGKFSKKGDMNTLIDDIFVLQNGTRNKVYILEEAHALDQIPGAQTALLEEIDRMPPNTYVIMCTTDERALLDELKSRAMKFSFGRLGNAESEMLLERELHSRGYSDIDRTTMNLIIRNSAGIPRELIKALDFVLTNSVTEEELTELFRTISNGTFIELFLSMKSSDINEMLTRLSDLTGQYSTEDVVRSFKDFVIRALFNIEGSMSHEGFTVNEILQLGQLFNDDRSVLYEVANLLSCLPARASTADVQLLFFRIRMLIQHQSLDDVAGARRQATISRERAHCATMAKEMDVFKQEEHNATKGLTAVSAAMARQICDI